MDEIMSINVRDLRVDNVLDPEEVEKLGEEVESYPARSVKPVGGLETREFVDPDTMSLTGVGFNMAKKLSIRRSNDSDEDLDEKIDQAIDRFAREFGERDTENPVYVRSEVIDILPVEDSSAGAFIKFQGIDRAYPVTLRSEEDLERAIQESEHKFVDDYVSQINARIQANDIIVPAIYAGEDYFPQDVPVSIVYSQEFPIAVSGDDPLVSEGIDDFDEGELGFSDHPYVERWSAEDQHGLTVDCVGAGIDSPEISLEEESVVIYDGGNEVYRFNPSDAGLSVIEEEEVETRFQNGVYNVRF